MSLASFFGLKSLGGPTNPELPEIFPLALSLRDFVRTDITTVYSKILTDCIERTQGIPKEVFLLLWDNCLQSESSEGLISLIAEAMTQKRDLFLVYKPSLGIVRRATQEESSQIRADYERQGQSPVGMFVSFKNYTRTDMVKIYSTMEYCVISSLNKQMNLSKAIQFKMNELRSSVSLTDASVARSQGIQIAQSLANGRDIMIDSKDEVATLTPDISATKESILFLDAKRCFYYGMPLSYINGEQTTGIGSTGEADTKAVERGLKQGYWIPIIKPVLERLFQIEVSYKSNDFRNLSSALEAVKTFDLVTDDYVSREEKALIVRKLLDLDEEQG